MGFNGIRSEWSLDLEERFGIIYSGKQEQGIYAIKLIDNDTVEYIGSTDNFYNRCRSYYSKPSKDVTSHEMHWWCWKHKGEWYFDIITSANGLSGNQLLELESNITDYYKSIGQAKHNKNSGAKLSEEHKAKISIARSGKHLSEETRAKISVAKSGENHPMYGKHFSEEHKAKISVANSKRVVCVSLDGTFTKTFGSGNEAERWLKENGHPKASQSAISNCCKGKQKTAYGYYWNYI